MATEDARFRQSTQFRLWSFSPAQLADLRAQTNALARASISMRLVASVGPASSTASASDSAATSAANTPNPSSEPQPGPGPPGSSNRVEGRLPEFLTPAEERRLLQFYTVELLRAAEFCELPTDIRATAAVFLRRFYVTNSIMTYPPTEILKTALFFGAKAEGFYTRLRK